MTGMSHVKAFRLFDLAEAEATSKTFTLTDWEKEHLHGCRECQVLLEVFVRQAKTRRPFFTGANGEVNSRSGTYKSLCCGLKLFVPEGATFPDCPAHKNLPTVWKRTKDA